MSEVGPRLGVTLPSLQRDPELALEAARIADAGGLDGVFVFDHLFRAPADRRRSGARRPSHEMGVLLGAVAAETKRVTFGPLVARATVRPAAELAAMLETAARLAPGRFVATIGAGDRESEGEQRAFGLEVGTVASRLQALERSVRSARGRGFPVWVGGRLAQVRDLAVRVGDGWNVWNVDAAALGRLVAETRHARAALDPGRDDDEFVCSWGGLVLVGDSDADAAAAVRRLAGGAVRDDVIHGSPDRVVEQLACVVEAGATWIVVALLDSSNLDGYRALADVVAPALRWRAGGSGGR